MKTFGSRLRFIRKEKQLRQRDVASALGVAQTAIANYEKDIRFPDHRILMQMAIYFDVSLDYLLGRDFLSEMEIESTSERRLLQNQQLRDQFLERLLRHDKESAIQPIIHLLNDKPSVEIFEQILRPTLITIGDKWQAGELDIPTEHYCSAVIEQLISYISIRKRTLDYKTKGHVVFGTIGSERHEIGLKMVASLFESDGWSGSYLGSYLPINSLVDAIMDTKATLLVLSATMASHLDALEHMIKMIRQNEPRGAIKIIVGGQAFQTVSNPIKTFDIDGYATDSKETLQLAYEFN